MTEENFFDTFNRIHNPDYYYGKQKKTEKKIKKKNKKQKNNPSKFKVFRVGHSKYPFVEIEWQDIEGDAGWSDTRALNKSKLPICVSRGFLVSQKNGITRLFGDYIRTKGKTLEFETIGNTTIIPTSVIQSIKKLS